MKIRSILLVILVCAWLFSCRKEYVNPTGPTPEVLVKTQQGMVELVVGIKNRFAVNNLGNGSLFNAISANGFTTSEISLKAGGNQNFGQLSFGKNNVATTNTVLTELWSNCMQINYFSTLLIDNIQNAKDPAVAANIRRYALLYKAMSIGTMAAYWEKIPITTGKNPAFVDTSTALQAAIAMLDEASLIPEPVLPDPYPATFGTEISLKNTLNALSARYNLMLGNYDQAILKAKAVDWSSKSYFIFNGQNPNPLYRSGFTSTFGYTAKQKFGLTGSLLPDAKDTLREIFYTRPFPRPGSNAGFGFGKSDNDAMPIYLVGEMMLILSESYARKNDATNSKIWLDSVLTKKRSRDPFGIGAELSAYQGPVDIPSLLVQIYKNRCIELFMSGLKLPDSRRFQRPGPNDPGSERSRNYYPIPLQERNGNSSTPPDPTG